MTDLIFYQKVASLNKENHGKLRLKPIKNFAFSAKTNSVPLVVGEFIDAARELPILFVKGADESFLPVALLGLREAENLFVKADGRWAGRYLPAFIRRYPFVPAEAGDGQMLICFDENAECLSETEGDLLFDENGLSPVLKNVMALLQGYQDEALRTQAFCKRLADCNLLVESNAQARLGDGSDCRLSGFYVVDQNRLQVLDKEKIHAFFSSGELSLIYAHLHSLGNLQHLVEKLTAHVGH
ncbi:SapC family protein [Propionivibrio sp.]|uniref:SapC family protein n=1 Tax=Propionivibrio sp. TaxID=2212460 RepID=UPI003BF23B39